VHTDISARLDAWLQAVDALLADPVSSSGSGGGVADDSHPPVPLGKLWVRFRKERDLELHVRTGWVFGTEFVQLLDFVPSRGVYANEILIHAGLLSELTDRFSSLVRYRGRR
jgi:hypothetical protein